MVSISSYRGMLCGTPRKDDIPENLSVAEKKLAAKDNEFFLSKVQFPVYREAVKKYGFSIQLND